MIIVILRGLENLVKAVMSLSDLQVNILYTIYYTTIALPLLASLVFFSFFYLPMLL